ncbi:MAG TPA: fumarylacetoacetate hydrolase family protein, partial [Actinomycetota bacterium]|nr:fumarylacetoacetate hydrolase family protein [Actinomycetota bacterium]
MTYDRGGERRLGALHQGRVIDLPDAVGHPAFPPTMEALVARNGGTTLDAAREAFEHDDVLEFAVDDARLLVPILPASLRDFLAFEDHVRRGAERRGTPVPDAWYEIPVYYKGNHRTVIGPEEVLPWPPFTEKLDFELEVACILGKPGRDLSEDQAAARIFGYTVMNDWSARDLQAREMSAWLGPAKSKDFATSLGPCVVTADEFDPSDCRLSARVDGEVWAEGNLKEMRWSFPQMVAYVSQGEDVEAGDVYGSGTFGGGCGLDLGRFLHPGAEV